MRLSGHTPISALQPGELPVGISALLPSLWVESVEEAISLTAAADAAGLKGEVFDELKRSLAGIIVNLPKEVLAPWMETPVFKDEQLGYRVDPEVLRLFKARGRISLGAKTPFSISDKPLPPAMRLMDKLHPVQNQGERGTCVAFSVTALREFSDTKSQKLSEQFLYWACKMLDGHEDQGGTTIHTAMAALAERGICPQDCWPYNPEKEEKSEHQGPPPAAALKNAASLVMENARPVAINNISHYKHVLAGNGGVGGAPVAIGILVFDSWLRSAATNRTGKITMPLPGEPPLQWGHAMLAVGYQDDPGAPGGGYLIVRNSWGTDWAGLSPENAGHAMIPYAYVEQCALEAFSGNDAIKSGIASVETAQKAFDDAYVVLLDGDMRDINGKLLRNGKRVIQDPGDPERIVEYTPKNMASFKKQNNRL